ncbi:sugar phosphate nucleotidyltransferase [Mesorhizobium sp. VNQ89]
MSERIVSFVISGGVGSRLWPLSREDNPKQFHDLAGQGSMLTKSLRLLAARPVAATLIYLIASKKHSRRVHADLAEMDVAGGVAIFEPTGRNTAAAVAVATGYARKLYASAIANGLNLGPEVEERLGRLFCWHIDQAPLGLWIDRIDDRVWSVARGVHASIFYYLVCALTQYLDSARNPKEGS